MSVAGRRVQMIEYDPEVIVRLCLGGVFRVAPVIPSDSTIAGAWFDSARYLGQAAIHSNAHELVRVGQALPIVPFPVLTRLEQ